MAIFFSSPNLLLLLLVSSADWLSTPGSAFLVHQDPLTPSDLVKPHFTECVSREQETFRCWWNPGDFHNLSSPGAIRVFYLKKHYPPYEWKECPEYIHANRECFFDMNHTSVWTPYCLQLRTSNNVTFFNEYDCFTVENIVRPDPPVSLNWSLLEISRSGLSYDVMVNWEPPPSANVGDGWMRLEYEIQYRENNGTNWEVMDLESHTQQTIYGLQIGAEYEVHIRSRMKAFTKFGDFSESIFIHVNKVTEKESTFPFILVLIFGIVGILILIMLIVVSQQHRLIMIVLPPVPAPRIKGIDPELLKKGKLDELNFIMSDGGMGGLPTYAPDFYQDEPWVEFIEVDAEDADGGEKEDNQGSDTQRLLGVHQSVGHHMNTGCSNTIGFPDDDSGRASCYDPDLADQDALTLMTTLLPGQTEDGQSSFEERAQELERPLVQTQSGAPQTWVNTDFYAQVSNVMPSGGVVLSPGQHLRIQESTPATEEEKGKEHKRYEEGKKPNQLQFQLLVVDPEGSGYTTESSARQISTPSCSPPPGEGYQTIPPQPVETKPVATAEGNESPYILPDSPQCPFFAPVADYTVVQEMDSEHSLLLNPPPPRQSPPPSLKALPSMPVGYITPRPVGEPHTVK